MGDEIKSVNGGTTSAHGMANGVQLTGYFAGAGGDKGHPGGGLRLSWVPSWLIGGDKHTAHFDLPVGLDVGHFSKDYTLPGGGEANSAFTRYGLRVAPTVRWVAPWLDRRLSASIGAGLGVGGFTTADSNMVSLPPSCKPGDFGRAECEPTAGPRSGNAGTAGLLYPRIGSSRGTEGAYFDVGIPLSIGVNLARGAWGNIGGFLGFEPGYTHLMPKDGGAFGFMRYLGFLGIQGSFGGSAVEAPRKTEAAPPSVSVDQMAEVASPTIAGSDAVDPVFDMTLANGKVLGTLDGTMTGPDGKAASFEFVDKEVKKYPATIRVKLTQKPLTPGVYTLNYTITSADKTQQAKGVAKFTVSAQPTLKLDKFSLIPSEFHAGNKNVKLRMESSLKDGDKVKKVTLTFKRKKDDKDETGVDIGVKPMTFESLTVGSKGAIEMEKLNLSALDGNASYLVTATVEGEDGQIKPITTSVNVKPKADLEVKGLGATYVPGTIAPLGLKVSGVDKVRVRVTVSATATVKPAWNKPEEEISVVDSQIVEVTNAKEEKVALRCQTADKKTVMIAEGGKNAKTGNYTVTFEAVNEKGEVIQRLSDPKNFSVAQPGVGPAAPGGPGKKSIKK
jgi:methionine-rich copper-binding protein CopC